MKKCKKTAKWKTPPRFGAALAVVASLVATRGLIGQTAESHELRLDRDASGLALRLSGGYTRAYSNYFDLFLIEKSTDLHHWEHWASLTRTNSDKHAVRVLPNDPGGSGTLFLRTATNVCLTPLPPPTGRFAVGTQSFAIEDASRAASLPGSSRQFMVTLWYPASVEPGAAPVRFVDDVIATDTRWVYHQFRNGTPTERFVANAIENAAPNPAAEEMPVILYSPSLNSHRRENVSKVEDLASHGFLVAALDHRDTFLSVFPDGRSQNGRVLSSSDLSALAAGIDDRVQDVQALLDHLMRMNSEDPEFAGRLRLDQIGGMGFSLGGATIAEAARVDERIRAVLNFDGAFVKGALLESQLDVPLLIVRADRDGAADMIAVFEHQMTGVSLVQIAGTVHWSFSDMPLLGLDRFTTVFGSPRSDVLDPFRVNAITARLALSFFNKELRGDDDGLLDDLRSAIPEVIHFEAK